MKNFAYQIVKKLQKSGYKAYITGGAVRDMLLDITPTDYDIATNATPDEIEKLIPNTIPVGKAFGVILAVTDCKKYSIEIATFRKDIEYKDGRRPSKIVFADDKEDALRRDFTINGLFYDPITDKIIDYVDGQYDLKRKVLRFIGNTEERVREDHLRLLRAIRFKNKYNLHYGPKTYETLKKDAHLIKKISKERIYDELVKIFCLKNIDEVILDLEGTGLLKVLMPELLDLKGVEQPQKYHGEGDVWYHTMLALKSIPKKANYLTRIGVLLHDIAKPKTQTIDQNGVIHFNKHCSYGGQMVQKILKRLKFSTKEIETVVFLVKHHMMYDSFIKMKPRRRHHWFKKKNFEMLLQVLRADTKACLPVDLSICNQIKDLYEEWLKNKPNDVPRLIDGQEIMKVFNLSQGKKIGELLELIKEAYLDEKIHSKEEALEFLKKKIIL